MQTEATQREETIDQSLARVNEARAYVQALIDADDHHIDAAKMAPYAARLAARYPGPQDRARLLDSMTGYLAGFGDGWEAGQVWGYQNGIADEQLVARRRGEGQPE